MLPLIKRLSFSCAIVAVYWFFAAMIRRVSGTQLPIVETLFVFTIWKLVILMTAIAGSTELYAIVMRLRYRGGRSREQMSKFFFG